jgi:hypothetical protein
MTTYTNIDTIKARLRGEPFSSSYKDSYDNSAIRIAYIKDFTGTSEEKFKGLAALDSAQLQLVAPRMSFVKKQNYDDYEYFFPFAPIAISYDGLADEVVEIPRPGTTPLIAFKAHRLLKVSFEFTIARVGDGIVGSVDNDMKQLRNMAGMSDRDVQFSNFDGMMTVPRIYRNDITGKNKVAGIRFKIAELTFSSVRRNEKNEISQATASITFIENNNPLVELVNIPKLKKPKPVSKKDKDKKLVGKALGLWSVITKGNSNYTDAQGNMTND